MQLIIQIIEDEQEGQIFKIKWKQAGSNKEAELKKVGGNNSWYNIRTDHFFPSPESK